MDPKPFNEHTQTTQRHKGDRRKSHNTHRKFKRCFKPLRDVGEKTERRRYEQEKEKVTKCAHIRDVPKLKS